MLRNVIKDDMLYLFKLLPSTTLVLSAILPCLNWSRSEMLIDKFEKKRKLLNRFMRRRLACYLGVFFLAHEDIKSDTPGFYFADGVHLSDVGNDIILLSICEVLEKLYQ